MLGHPYALARRAALREWHGARTESAMTNPTTRPNHLLRPALIVLPIALFSATLAAFVGFAASHAAPAWELGLWCNVLGLGVGLLALAFGAVSLRASPMHESSRPLARAYLVASGTALALFAANLVAQHGAWTGLAAEFHAVLGSVVGKPDLVVALVLSSVGAGAALVSGVYAWQLTRRRQIALRFERADVAKHGALLPLHASKR